MIIEGSTFVNAERVEFEDFYYLRMLVPGANSEVRPQWFLPQAERAEMKFWFDWVGYEKQQELEAIYQTWKTLNDVRAIKPA
jgi:hypothetical protein